MQRKIVVLLGLLLLAMPSLAQEFKRAEIFGGYQYTHVDPNVNGNGWNAALTGYATRWLGVTGDFSGSYKSGSSLHTYMVGPTLALRTPRATPFVHALFGGAHADQLNAFAMGVGGGLDVHAGEHFSVRLLQADWLMFRRAGVSINKNVRLSAGVVFRF